MEAPMGDKGQAVVAARRLMRAADRAALATGSRNDGNWPYPSLVLVACDYDGAPLLFISGLAEHTRNIAADPRVGLLFDATAGLDEPLSGARISVLGRAVPTQAPHHRARFLARQPSARRLTALADFTFYKVAVERAHLVAGFGRARWLAASELLPPPAADGPSMAAAEAAALAEVAAAGIGDALYRVSRAGAAAGPEEDRPSGFWAVTGIDPDGVDLRGEDGQGKATARANFSVPLHRNNDWGAAVRALAGGAASEFAEIQ